MTSRKKLETKILSFIGIGIVIFIISTLHLFQHLSSYDYINNSNHPVLLNSFDHFLMSSLSYHHDKEMMIARKNAISVVDQVHFLTNEEVDNAIKSIPFPQSIYNEEMEMILHPALDMMNFIHNIASDTNKGMEEEEEQAEGQQSKNQMIKVPKFWNPTSLLKGANLNNPIYISNHQNEQQNSDYPLLEIRSFLGNYGERLMTTSEAKLIGSYTRPSSSSSSREGKNIKQSKLNEDDTLLETIFVSIASYRDYRCPHTLRQIFKQATYPERIRVAIVDQLKQGVDSNCGKHTCDTTSSKKNDDEEGEEGEDILCKYSHLIDVYEMDATLAVGPVLARHIGNRMYRGEYFAMQSDAHMEFIKGWDVDIIQQWKSANNEMAVLTTYVSDVDGSYNHTTGMSMKTSRPKMCNTDFDTDYYDNRLSNLMHGQQPEGQPDVIGEPTLQPFWAAGFSFSRGHFIINVPYDRYLPMIFQGEEINIGLRGFTYGYDFYAPERSVIYHYYSHGGKDKKVKSFYENSELYDGLEQASMARLLGITELLPDAGGNADVFEDKSNATIGKTNRISNSSHVEFIKWNEVEENMYGIGKVRTTKKFLQTFGINIFTKEVQNHLCQFVGKPMNKMFLSHLRKDTMGVDYDEITYEFKDPKVHGKTWEGDNGDDAGEEEE